MPDAARNFGEYTRLRFLAIHRYPSACKALRMVDVSTVMPNSREISLCSVVEVHTTRVRRTRRRFNANRLIGGVIFHGFRPHWSYLYFRRPRLQEKPL